jgi:hypothetical protein
MTVTNTLYAQSILNAYMAGITDISAGGTAVKVCLLDNDYTFSQAHDTYTDVSGEEVSGTNYATGGVALASKTLTRSSGVVTFDSADVTFTNITVPEIHYAIVYEVASGKLISCIDFGEDIAVTAKDFYLSLSPSGIFYITV